MNVLENLVLNTFKYVSENCTEEQKIIGNEIVVPNNPFKKITYSQALDELNGKDAKLEFGNDLLDSHLRILGESHPEFYFITDWPLKLKPFYIMKKKTILIFLNHLICNMVILNCHQVELDFTTQKRSKLD